MDKNCEILCFSGEKDVPYNRCFLADFLTGDSSYQDLLLKPESFEKLERMGDKSINNILAGIEQAKEYSISRVIYAMGIKSAEIH